MIKRLKIAALFITLFFSGHLFSQLQVKNFFSFAGKKDLAVNIICQDYNGHLWLGTNEGLYKFDGRQAAEVLKENRLLKQPITALYADINDVIWIGTKSGKIYTLTKNRLDSINTGAKANEDKITSFCSIDSGMCVGTYGNGVFFIKGKQVSNFTGQNGIGDNVVYKVESDRKHRVWCGTDAGISEINFPFGKTTFRSISNKNGLPDNIVRDISFEEDRLLISMQDSGTCYYDLKKNAFIGKLLPGNWDKGTVLASAQRSPGKYVIATEKSGLVEIVNGEVHNYDYSTYIQNASINFLFIDNTRQVWLASKKGLSHFVEKRFHLVNAISGLSNNKILAITADTRNAMWVGTTMGIASLENGPGSSMAMGLSHDLDKITVSCAARAPDGSIWYGTYGNGIIILKPGDNNWTVLNSQNGHLSNDNISNIYFAKDNTVYISTLGGGLIKAEVIPSASGTIRILKTYMENDGLGNSYVYCAITDERSRLFVASDGGGLQVLDKGKFVDLTRKFGLMSNTIFSLCKDRYNNIWAVSNADGIIKYTSHDSLIAITQANGLRELQPQQIIAVDNTLYAFNSKGVDKINCLNNSISYVDIFENDVEPNLNAVWYENGKILSGTTNGVLVFRTGSTRLDSIKPSAYISGLLVNYKPFPLDSIYEFKYKQNNIAISFGGVWLKNPEALSFRYRLNGLEEDWQYAEEAKTVNYNNLPPGEYTFILQSKNDEDIWSEPVGYYFVILTPLWKRWWFWLLIISIFSIGIYAFFRYRIRALKRQNQELESRVEERTREIAQQARIIEDKNKELERLSLVASKTDNSVLILDPDGRLEYVNESFFKLNGLTLDDLKRNYGETIFEFSNNPNITDLVNEAVTRKKSVHYESLNSKVKGETDIWESSTLTPIFDEQGILKKIIIIDTDVSKIKRQEQIITQKNKDITDSISYARKIQQAILPREGLIKKFLPNSFIVYLTKDIVSGDFYWFTHFNNCSIIAAVDCTGHGVPGAFMSIIGYSLLNRIINEKKVTDPAEILLELNNGVLNILHKNESESKDGMDIAVCKINHHQQTLEYAGAMRPLWLIANNELTEIKADKIPIGTKQKDREETIRYTTHVIPFTTGNSFYIFTDGYADQFGGSKDKKYSTARFKEFLTANASLNFGDQETAVRDEHYKWKGKNEQVDDILLIGFTA